jgi:TMEM175 potassium channel family protein
MSTPRQEVKETGRLEAFSDGVFAIAITLLILEIRVPPAEGAAPGALWPALLRLWPSYLAYAISFGTILVMWLNHHALFKVIKRIDNRFILLNGLLMMAITFVNFPTAVLAEYIEQPDAQAAALFYSGTYVVVALIYNALWLYASHKHRLLDPAFQQELVHEITRQFRFGPVMYLVAFGAAFVSVPVSVAVNAGLAIFYAFTGSRQTMSGRDG